jgi:hypothetical protein
MKTSVFALSISILVTALLVIAFGFSQSSPGERITVMNPAVANRLAERRPLAARLDTLEGKTIYMIDINWGGPEAAQNVFEEMQAWFSRNMPSVKTVLKMKKGGYDADDPALWKEIQDHKGDGAMLGVSG